jgi:two-component system, NtrC family, nitrogen regulation sensor histidine kinase NtrY
MSETPSLAQRLARRVFVIRRRFGRWARRSRFWPKIEAGLAVALILTTISSYILLTGGGTRPRDTLTSDTRILTVLLLNAGLLLVTAFFVVRRILILTSNRKRGLAGARLHARMTRLFAILAVVPTIIVAAYATLLFDYSSSPWTGKQINLILSNAENVARAYVDETRQRIRSETIAMGRDLRGPVLSESVEKLGDRVQVQAALRNLSEAYVFRKEEGRQLPVALAASDFWTGTQENKALRSEDVDLHIRETRPGEVIFWSGPNDERPEIIRAIVQINQQPRLYLVVGREISSDVFAQADTTRRALQDFQSWNERRRTLQKQFMVVLAVLSLLILLAAIWAALYSADTMIAPIGRMVRAAERVAKGDLGARVAVRGEPDDLGILAKTFNRMTSQLQAQTGALMSANEQLDERRRFTEAVLSGVSAGVLGLDGKGVITLPNRSAAALLELDSDWLTGQPLEAAMPEAVSLFEEARGSAQKSASGLVTINHATGQKILMMQISADGQEDVARGYVVTFDDVTDSIANQRRAAWSDVARRIAHEIKNPLTPIQLSAERLRRKYLKEIQTEPEVFVACTDTIIRQVNDLRRMVDEFSSFARMPKPVFRKENIVEVIRQVIFQQELAAPTVQMSFNHDGKSVPIYCDSRQLAQAFTNIIKNACESIAARTESGADFHKKIDIQLQQNDELVDLVISDTGIGLPTDIRETITEPYVTTRPKGTGLGLAIVKKIVEDHFGTLSLEDAPDGGASVRIQFNKALAQAHHEKLASLQTESDSDRNVVPLTSMTSTETPEKKVSYGS